MRYGLVCFILTAAVLLLLCACGDAQGSADTTVPPVADTTTTAPVTNPPTQRQVWWVEYDTSQRSLADQVIESVTAVADIRVRRSNVPVTEDALCIRLDDSLPGYLNYRIDVSDDGQTVTLRGSGVAGLYYAAAAIGESIRRNDETAQYYVAADSVVHNALEGDESMQDKILEKRYGDDAANKTFARDRLLRADGTVNSDLTGDLNIVFIGGSLTQGGTDNWEKMICDYYREKYPLATVNATNAGVGGTGSSDGATRYNHDVLSYNPDVVFIEFAINDNGRKEAESKLYLEAMLYQSTLVDKIPVIMGLYCPFGGDKDIETYKAWSNQVLWKQQVHDYYGIPTVNIYDYYWAQYEAYRADGHADVSYVDFLGGQNQDNAAYYHDWNESSRQYNVHCNRAGYVMYGRAVLEAFEADGGRGFTEMMAKNHLLHDSVLCSGPENEKIIRFTYSFTGAASDRFSYEDSASCKWYDFTGRIQSGDVDPGKNLMQYFPDGVKAVERSSSDAGEEVSFSFTTSAQAIAFKYPASLWGLNADVYVDGVLKGSVRVQSVYSAAYTTTFVNTGIFDGAEHTVRVVVSDFITGERNDRYNVPQTSDINIFRFGYLIERYNGN